MEVGALAHAHDRKIFEAVRAMGRVRDLLSDVARDTRESSVALRGEAEQAERRFREVVGEAHALIGEALRLITEAQAIKREATADQH